MSERYGRMAVADGEGCDQYTPSVEAPSELGGPTSKGATCSECHYWFPLESMVRIGRCDNTDSAHFRAPEFGDKAAEGCFVARSLEGLEFAWCQSHRQTIHSHEFPSHRGCRVFVSTVNLPVEDEMELTLAGD